MPKLGIIEFDDFCDKTVAEGFDAFMKEHSSNKFAYDAIVKFQKNKDLKKLDFIDLIAINRLPECPEVYKMYISEQAIKHSITFEIAQDIIDDNLPLENNEKRTLPQDGENSKRQKTAPSPEIEEDSQKTTEEPIDREQLEKDMLEIVTISGDYIEKIVVKEKIDIWLSNYLEAAEFKDFLIQNKVGENILHCVRTTSQLQRILRKMQELKGEALSVNEVLPKSVLGATPLNMQGLTKALRFVFLCEASLAKINDGTASEEAKVAEQALRKLAAQDYSIQKLSNLEQTLLKQIPELSEATKKNIPETMIFPLFCVNSLAKINAGTASEEIKNAEQPFKKAEADNYSIRKLEANEKILLAKIPECPELYKKFITAKYIEKPADSHVEKAKEQKEKALLQNSK